ncbi:FAD/NAD(P)-binding domain-containing protein [Fistulina hepatica ATCC 64428]|nr:FAD/NAD(P)-binding domain-containing protein [Fistulina hepatica ATCC 64428]
MRGHGASLQQCTALLLLFGCISSAFNLPFRLPFLSGDAVVALSNEPPVLNDTSAPTVTTPRIAVIGAGAAGSSAAFWISKAQQRFGLDVEVDLYERASYVGGRSTVVYPDDDETLPPMELGGSIFVPNNKNMMRAVAEFNLTLKSFSDDDASMAVWDGKEILFTSRGGWWDYVKFVFRYGVVSARRIQSIVDGMVVKFLTLYEPDVFVWQHASEVAASLGWEDLLQTDLATYAKEHGVTSEKFLNEILEASTRVNYGQNAVHIHALGGAVSLASGKASGVLEGNYKIFENLLSYSSANVLLNTTVLSMEPKESSWLVTSSSGTTEYAAVILAAPLYLSGIAIPETLVARVPEQPYVPLKVTLLTTNSKRPDPAYFGVTSESQLADFILTTEDGLRHNRTAGPEFNSLSYHGEVRPGEWAVKIFSKEFPSDEWLSRVFQGSVNWVYRKEWDAYPVLSPSVALAPVKLEHGFYYVNGFEGLVAFSFILMSTMETEIIASRNAVELMLNEMFNSGICGPRRRGPSTAADEVDSSSRAVDDEVPEDFVFGWDC